jgi:hypothetical protein
MIIVKSWRGNMGRTISEITVPIDESKASGFILNWLVRNDFDILEKESSGNVIEKSFRFNKIRLTTHAGSIVALHRGRLGKIVFEIRVKSKESGCLVHGEFYCAGGGGGIPDFLGKEIEVSARPGIVGRVPSKKGFRLMNKFISDLKGEFSRM